MTTSGSEKFVVLARERFCPYRDTNSLGSAWELIPADPKPRLRKRVDFARGVGTPAFLSWPEFVSLMLYGKRGGFQRLYRVDYKTWTVRRLAEFPRPVDVHSTWLQEVGGDAERLHLATPSGPRFLHRSSGALSEPKTRLTPLWHSPSAWVVRRDSDSTDRACGYSPAADTSGGCFSLSPDEAARAMRKTWSADGRHLAFLLGPPLMDFSYPDSHPPKSLLSEAPKAFGTRIVVLDLVTGARRDLPVEPRFWMSMNGAPWLPDEHWIVESFGLSFSDRGALTWRTSETLATSLDLRTGQVTEAPPSPGGAAEAGGADAQSATMQAERERDARVRAFLDRHRIVYVHDWSITLAFSNDQNLFLARVLSRHTECGGEDAFYLGNIRDDRVTAVPMPAELADAYPIVIGSVTTP